MEVVVKGVGPGFLRVDEEDVTGGKRGLCVKITGWCEDLGRGNIVVQVVVCGWCLGFMVFFVLMLHKYIN